MSGGHGHVETSNKKIALLVAILAAALAISEMGGKSSQTNALTSQVDRFNFKLLYSGAFRSPSIENINLNAAIRAEQQRRPLAPPRIVIAEARRPRAFQQDANHRAFGNQPVDEHEIGGKFGVKHKKLPDERQQVGGWSKVMRLQHIGCIFPEVAPRRSFAR